MAVASGRPTEPTEKAPSSRSHYPPRLRPFPLARHNWSVKKALLLAFLALWPVYAQDATAIIRQSVERDATNFERFKNYTFLERIEERRYGRSGSLSSKEIQTYEFMVLGGRPY